ncbi:hypothetical protein TNCV_2087041 [Trichonephila clavipes]|nr:hypothetical protein TNCV_2087041 [Trichonephila clavipes]
MKVHAEKSTVEKLLTEERRNKYKKKERELRNSLVGRYVWVSILHMAEDNSKSGEGKLFQGSPNVFGLPRGVVRRYLNEFGRKEGSLQNGKQIDRWKGRDWKDFVKLELTF